MSSSQVATSEEVFDLVDHYTENLDCGRALSVLIPYMDWEHGSQIIDHSQHSMNEDVWNKEVMRTRTRKSITEDMKDYMPHAWELVAKRRHAATTEALEHYQVWLSLMGEDALSDAMQSFGEHDYGATELAIVCQHFGWEYGHMDTRLRLV